MVQIYVGAGTNRNRITNIHAALDALEDRFGALITSPTYASKAVGMRGPDFYNLVVGLSTNDDAMCIRDVFKSIENACDRTRDANNRASVELDLDMLTYGDEIIGGDIAVPHADILRHSYILRPLAEIAPHTLHPQCGKTYGDLWAEGAAADTPLVDVTHLIVRCR